MDGSAPWPGARPRRAWTELAAEDEDRPPRGRGGWGGAGAGKPGFRARGRRAPARPRGGGILQEMPAASAEAGPAEAGPAGAEPAEAEPASAGAEIDQPVVEVEAEEEEEGNVGGVVWADDVHATRSDEEVVPVIGEAVLVRPWPPSPPARA